MPAFPPAEVTTLTVQPKSYPVTFEYVGQALGSKDVEVRARVTGILEKRLYQRRRAGEGGQPLFLIDPKPYEAQCGQRRGRDRARAGPASAGRARGRRG